MHVGIVAFFTNVDHTLDLANGLHQAGATVTLFLSRAHVARTMDDADQPAEALYRRGLLAPQVRVRLFQMRRMRDPRSYAVVRRMIQAIHADGVDVVHLIMGGGELWAAALANLLTDVPVAANLVIPQPNIGEFPPAPVAVALNRLLVRGSQVVIVNGRDHVELVQRMYGVPASRVRHVPLGPFHTLARWAAGVAAEEPGNVLFFGRANRHKGLEILVRAQPILSKRVPHARLVIAAHGKEMDRCLPLMEDASRFEVHAGFLRGDAAAALFQRAALVALPYLTASTSGVLMNAYVFGKPVVATRVGSLPEYVQDGVTGLLVPPADVEALADALSRLLLDDDLRRRMGHNALEWIEGDLSWRVIAAQHLEVYDQAVALHMGRGRGAR